MDSALQPCIQRAIHWICQASPEPLVELVRHSTRNELIILGGASFLTLYNLVSYIQSRTQKLRQPPLVPYALPILGHSLYMWLDSNRFIDWCTSRYGQVYDVILLGTRTTIASGKAAEEVLKADSELLSLEKGILRDVIFLHYAIDETTFEIGFHVNPVVAKNVIPQKKLPEYMGDIEAGLARGLEELAQGRSSFVVQHPAAVLQRLVAHMSIPTLVGKEVDRDPLVLQSFADFTSDIVGNVGLFMTVPKFLHGLIRPFVQSINFHRDVMKTKIEPVVAQRRLHMKQAAEQGVPHNLPINFLQGLLEFTKPDGTQYTVQEVAQSVLLISFASVHTTSMNLSFSLYWLLARPDLKDRLLEEINAVLGDRPITMEALQEMTLLDNFVREVLRQGVDKLANGKAVLKDHYTFANGYQIPKGRIVQSTNRQLHYGQNSFMANVDEMDPALSKNKSATQPSRDMVTFGMGKHLCPGRFLAVLEIKMSLIALLRAYDIRTKNGKRPRPLWHLGGTVAMTSQDPLVFTRRTL